MVATTVSLSLDGFLCLDFTAFQGRRCKKLINHCIYHRSPKQLFIKYSSDGGNRTLVWPSGWLPVAYLNQLKFAADDIWFLYLVKLWNIAFTIFFIKTISSCGRDQRFIAAIIFSLADVSLPSGKPKLCLNMFLMIHESERQNDWWALLFHKSFIVMVGFLKVWKLPFQDWQKIGTGICPD